jgi:hypothetical protein
MVGEGCKYGWYNGDIASPCCHFEDKPSGGQLYFQHPQGHIVLFLSLAYSSSKVVLNITNLDGNGAAQEGLLVLGFGMAVHALAFS